MSEAALAGNPSTSLAMMNGLSAGGTSGSPTAQLNALAEMLLQQFGESTVQQSVNNIAAQMIGDLVMKMIDSLPMPDFMADEARQAVSDVMSDFTAETPNGLDEQTAEVLGTSKQTSGDSSSETNGAASGGGSSSSTSGSSESSGGGSDVSSIMDSAMMDELESASKEGAGNGGGNQNWLVVLARALGATSGKHLKDMIEAGQEMGGIDSKQDPEAFAQLQSEFQALSQIFKMLQEAIATLIKSIGESLAAVARKQ